MKADAKRAHLFGGYDWRLFPEYFERVDRRGYRRLFDRVFYDEIESLTVFRAPDGALAARGIVFALLTAPALLLLRLATPDWRLPLLGAGGEFALVAGSAALLGFARGKTVLRVATLFGPREIVFNRSAAFTRRFVGRLVTLIRAAQAGSPAAAS